MFDKFREIIHFTYICTSAETITIKSKKWNSNHFRLYSVTLIIADLWKIIEKSDPGIIPVLLTTIFATDLE